MHSNKNILLVSSNPVLNSRIERYLSPEKYQLTYIEMEDDSLKDVLEKNLYDMVIVDSDLPGWQGIKTGVMIRCWSNIPMFILSTCNTLDDEIRMLDLVSEDYLGNPVGMPYLAIKIERLLSADSPLMGI